MPVSGGVGQFSNTVLWREQACLPLCRPPASKTIVPAGLPTAELWSPAYLSSTKAWLQGNHLFQPDGSSFAVWHDDSGNGNNTTSIGNDPDARKTFLNDMDVAQFTGANTDFLQFPSGMVSAFTEGAIFFVAKAASGSTMGLPVTRFGSLAGATDEYSSDGLGSVGTAFLSTAAKTIPDPGGTTNWHIGAFRSKSSDWRMRWNGTENYTTGTNTVGAQTGQPYLGYDAVGFPFNGHLAEVVLTNSFLTTAEAEQIEGYLAWKWGLQANLPVGHAYASAAPSLPSPISGTSSLSFTPAGTLTGNGALAGASTLTFSPAATIKGLAPITGSSSLTFSLSGSITGKGALSGSSSVTFSPTGAITGKGALTGASSLTFAPTATIKGLAPVSGTSALSFTTSGTITGKGALAGASSVVFSAAGTLGAAGSTSPITGTSSISFSSAGNIQGLAPLSGSASFVLSVAGSLTGKGRLVGNAPLTFTETGTLTGFRVWTDTDPQAPAFSNDNPVSTTWTEVAAETDDFTESVPDNGIWTETPPNTGTWD